MTFKHHRAALPGNPRIRLGIAGPSRSGKTYSALRVAAGMGGPVFFIDTENGMALDYAGKFSFEHVNFEPPYTSERYREAIEYCVGAGAGVIVIDQMTHEHTGSGGILERHEQVKQSLAAKWKTSQDKATWAAWAEVKAPHQKLVDYIQRLKIPMIFNFRAKDKLKITPGKEPVHMGWTPICTEQFDYEMSAMIMLAPNSKGFPDNQFSELRSPLDEIINLQSQLNEDLGRRMVSSAKGNPAAPAPTPVKTARKAAQTDAEWLDELVAAMASKTDMDALRDLIEHPNIKNGLAKRPAIADQVQEEYHRHTIRVSALEFDQQQKSGVAE